MNTKLAERNFLPEQYETTGALEINHNYLQPQFADHAFEFGSHVDQSLRRDASADQAGAAQAVALHQHGVDPELAGPDRSDIASWPAAQNQEAGGDGLGPGFIWHGVSP